jgi:hypothetical protein
MIYDILMFFSAKEVKRKFILIVRQFADFHLNLPAGVSVTPTMVVKTPRGKVLMSRKGGWSDRFKLALCRLCMMIIDG